MFLSILEMLAQLFLLMWIGHNGAQAVPGGSIKAVCVFFLKDKSLDLLKLSGMPVNYLGVAKRIDHYKQQHLNIFFFEHANLLMRSSINILGLFLSGLILSLLVSCGHN